MNNQIYSLSLRFDDCVHDSKRKRCSFDLKTGEALEFGIMTKVHDHIRLNGKKIMIQILTKGF